LFYTDNFTTLWERTLRGVAAANTTNIGDSGRMFALANMAAADAIITAWTDKRGFASGGRSRRFKMATTMGIHERPATRHGRRIW
jgi:hypothetical protein